MASKSLIGVPSIRLLAITVDRSSRRPQLPVVGDLFEIHEEVGDHALQVADAAVAGHDGLATRAVELRVGGAEEFLGQLEHPRLVRRRHAQDLHDHPQRIGQRHVADEVALAAQGRHAVDVVPGDLADAALQPADVLGQEPGLGEDAVFRMVRGVHLHQGPQQVRTAAGHALDDLVALDRGEGGRPVPGVEQVVLTADLQDVGVLAHDPEGIDPLQLDPGQRRVGPQPAEGLVHRPVLGIGRGREHRARDVVGNVHCLPHVSTAPPSPGGSLAQARAAL